LFIDYPFLNTDLSKGGLAMWMSKEEEKYIPQRMTGGQMQALEEYIALSPDGTDFGRKAMIWLLRQSENLTKSVAASFPEQELGSLASEVELTEHNMGSAGGKTHLSRFMRGMGTHVGFSGHYGCLVIGKMPDPLDFKFPGVTIWISHLFYDRDAHIIPDPKFQEINEIALYKL
jgi:hypothetical protein